MIKTLSHLGHDDGSKHDCNFRLIRVYSVFRNALEKVEERFTERFTVREKGETREKRWTFSRKKAEEIFAEAIALKLWKS